MPRRAALSVPENCSQRSARPLSIRARRRMAAGGAREHGGQAVRAPAARGVDRRSLSAALRGPRAQRKPVGGLGGVAPGQPAETHSAGIRHRRHRIRTLDGAVEGSLTIPMTNIVVPELGESVVEARVARWLKKEGERVEVGEPVVELETEKID